MATLALIPSPPGDSLSIGPLSVRFYGLALAVAVLVGSAIAARRWERRGGERDDIYSLAMWAVPAGLVGARLWHVLTDNELYRERPLEALALWEGGLGIPGGIIAGVAVGLVVARRRGMPLRPVVDAVVPALPVAQAIGRLGNWFNQELYGRPTDLPWGLAIEEGHRPPGYVDVEAFHPTFAYEALWNVGLFAVLIALDRRRVLPPGALLFVYLLGYGLGRLWVEALRVDPANTLLGLRVNIWTAMGFVVVGGAGLVVALVRAATTASGSSADSGSNGSG